MAILLAREAPQLYPFPSAIIPSFSDNERSRGGNAIYRDDGRKWGSRVVSVLARSVQRARRRSRLIQEFYLFHSRKTHDLRTLTSQNLRHSINGN
ncbi:hypothetical protein DBV15_06906 [Temnothorax longispinosus]|uniref:Uncharacterized protein n=1 Tax=Temnothorax longispinosus TaxID=300112 RepID=A0A4S2J9J8_9HYME|nr:hypothetical protein DBV15_06906 [Temnothorax longispinosus]